MFQVHGGEGALPNQRHHARVQPVPDGVQHVDVLGGVGVLCQRELQLDM